MKQRKFKFSLGMKIASILSCIALVSVGFASWWIVKPPQTKTASGSFEVYTVSTKNITISEPTFTDVTLDKDGKDETVSSSKIIFGKKDFPANKTNYKWLLAGKEIYDENLTATMNFTVSVTDGDTNTGTSNVSDFLENVKLTLEVPAKLKTAISNKYLANAKIAYTTTGGTAKSGEVSIDGTKDTVELLIDMTGANSADADNPVYSVGVTVTFTFAWGEKFHNENPYTYFNAQAYAENLATEAQGVLGDITELNGDTYKATLVGTLNG